MKKFSVEVTRADEYEIEVDENVWNEKELADWSKCFNRVGSVQEIAENLAVNLIKIGSANGFIEGFGYVKTFRISGDIVTQFANGKIVPPEEYCAGINVRIISEDYNYDCETEEIKLLP